MRTEKLSPEIERSIADAHSLADQIEAAASSEERCRLADLLCKKVDETIGMIVRADAVSVSPKRQRKPAPSSKQTKKVAP